MQEEVRAFYSQYFSLAESVYLKKKGTEKKQIEWLKKNTAFYKIVGKYCYYKEKELEKKKDLLLQMTQPIGEAALIEQIESCIFYLFTVQEETIKKNYDMEEQLLLHLWNSSYLDVIRQSIGGIEKKTPKLSLGPGFYNIEMKTADMLYDELAGQKYGIKLENHRFVPAYTCCGIFLYGDCLKSLQESPCKTCKAINNCEACMYL